LNPAWTLPSLVGMAVWGELRVALARVLEERPGALTRYPDLDQRDGGALPYRIGLAAWAEADAGELYRRFGDLVSLTVGALPYPPGASADRPVPSPGQAADPLGPEEADVELDGPAVVRSGHTLRHGLLVRNRSGAELAIATNGVITAFVVDLGRGEVVGGFSGAQHLPLITFRVPPAGTERIPLLIGTASVDERLGYVVPPGDWGVQVTLDLMPGGEPPYNRERILRRTPVRPLEITA
jgi:hypothetical protein